MKILIVILLSVLCGVLYRMGGSKNWNTKFRDIGSSLCMAISIIVLFGVHRWVEAVTLIVSAGIMFGALTSYRYFLKKPDDYTCWYYMLHGFFVALAILPWAIADQHLTGMILRAAVCGLAVGAWSGVMRWDIGEEFGRGFIMCSSLLLLLLF